MEAALDAFAQRSPKIEKGGLQCAGAALDELRVFLQRGTAGVAVLEELAVLRPQLREAMVKRLVPVLEFARIRFKRGGDALDERVIEDQPALRGEAAAVVHQVVANHLERPSLEAGADLEGGALLPEDDVYLL